MYGETEPVGTGIRNQPTTGRKRPSRGKRGGKRPNPPRESREARYGRLAQNPNTRASVPDEYLSPEHRRVREMNRRLNTPVGGGTNATYRDVAREAQADANVRYGQQEGEIRSQFGRSAVQMNRLPAYMEQYRAALAQAQQQAQATYAQAAAQARGVGAQDAANTAQGQSALVGQMQADAAQRGGSVDPALLQQAIQAAGVRQGRSEIQGQYMDALGAGESSFYGRGQSNIPLRLIEELDKERGVQNELERSRRQLLGEKGEYQSSQRSKILDRERGYGLENQVLGLNTAKAVSDAEQKELDRKQRERDARTKRQQQLSDKQRDREFREQDREDRQQFQAEQKAKKEKEKGTKLGKPGKEPGSSLGVRRNLLDRRDTIGSLAASQNLKTREDFKRATTRSRKGWYTPGIEQLKTAAALDLTYGDRIASGTLKALRERGVYVTSTGEYWGGGNRGSK